MLVMSSLRMGTRDRGSFLVVGAIVLGAFALLGGGLLEFGQWYQHRRNLQVRTDAAALAGGTLFNECFNTLAFTPAQAAADMETLATKYSGIPGSVTINGTSATSSYNRGWQGFTTGNDGIGFQSNTYPTPGGGLPPRNYNSPASSEECDTLELDVKQSQNLPNILSIATPQWTTHGWARVQEQQVEAVKPSLPLAIPNFDLSHVGVTFVDETTGGNELSGCTGSLVAGGCTYELTKNPNPVTGQDGEAVTEWNLSSATINLPAPTGASGGDLIGVRVAVGSAVGSCANTTGTTLYACVDLNDTSSGIVGIRDYKAPPQPAPALYEVWPSETCSSDTSPYFSDLTGQSSCTVTLQAKVASGTGCATNPETDSPPASLSATMPAGYSITLHVVPGSCDTHGWLWNGSTTLGIDANSPQSEYPVTLNYHKGSASPTWTNVQRFTSGSFDDDGPVRMISLSGGAGNPYSSAPGSDTVGVRVVTSQAGISNQLVVLRQAHNGSSTAFMLCVDGGSGSPYNPENGTPGIQDGMQNGCSFSYAINQNLAAADPCATQPLPAECVPNKTSAAGGNPLVTRPLNARFGCSANPPTYPDRWPIYSTPGDKRAVVLLLTTYNAYSNGGKTNGKQLYPVVGFGDFYITGFSGDNCSGDAPAPPQIAGDNQNAGDIWGYFIKYDSGAGIPSGRKCKPNELGECVAALIR
jgi:hypothetical protein